MDIFVRGVEVVQHLMRISTRTGFIKTHRYWRQWRKRTSSLYQYTYRRKARSAQPAPKTLELSDNAKSEELQQSISGMPAKFMCKACDPLINFEDNKSAVDHFVIKHSSSSGLYCNICEKQLDKRSFRMHYKAVHVYNDGVCTICKRVYQNIYKMERHMSKAHNFVSQAQIRQKTSGQVLMLEKDRGKQFEGFKWEGKVTPPDDESEPDQKVKSRGRPKKQKMRSPAAPQQPEKAEKSASPQQPASPIIEEDEDTLTIKSRAPPSTTPDPNIQAKKSLTKNNLWDHKQSDDDSNEETTLDLQPLRSGSPLPHGARKSAVKPRDQAPDRQETVQPVREQRGYVNPNPPVVQEEFVELKSLSGPSSSPQAKPHMCPCGQGFAMKREFVKHRLYCAQATSGKT